ncbi:MAG: DMP19 family protein [Prevotellaceae bacterium]|nr:DMP19 family protein [Prevotellaceae bacterium]
MNIVNVKDADLRKAAENGMDEFVKVFVDATLYCVGGQLNADTMGMLNADQITLLAYHYLQEEVMDGGFVQLIHNGYGGFIFMNPFAKAVREWGISELASLVNKARSLYYKHHEAIEKDCSDEEFMAMFERYSGFDDLDDKFVENEETWTSMVAHYIDEHIDRFAEITE